MTFIPQITTKKKTPRPRTNFHHNVIKHLETIFFFLFKKNILHLRIEMNDFTTLK